MGEIRKKIFHVKLKTGKFSETKLNFKLKTSNETEKMKNLDRLRLHEFAIPSYITWDKLVQVKSHLPYLINGLFTF